MQELATLKQVGIYRPYQLTIDGKNIGYVRYIYFYNDNGNIYELNQGWLECNRKDIPEIKLNIVKRIKKNLTRKENFVIGKSDNLHLYLYIDNENIKLDIEKRYDYPIKQDYALNTAIYKRVVFSGVVDNKAVNFENCEDIEYKTHPEKENAEFLYETLTKNYHMHIDKYDFMKLFNICDIKIRDVELMNE